MPPKDDDEEKLIDNKRLFAFILAGLGFVFICLSVVFYLPLKMHVVLFVIFFILGLSSLILGLYILVKTKPVPPPKEEYDETVPDSSVEFDDWAKTAPVNTLKSERPDPSQYKKKKEYKAFPVKAPSSGASESRKEAKED